MNAFRSVGMLAALLAALLAPAVALAQASASPYTSAQRYDATGRVTGTISADPDTVGSGNPFLAVRNSFDGAGRLIKVETGTLSAWQSEAVAPATWTGFSVNRTLETLYDSRSRKIRDTVRESSVGTIRAVTQYSYDNLGRLTCTAVRMNPALFGSLPASACDQATPAGSDGPDRITRNVYDAAGQRLQSREGVGTGDEAAEATWAYSLNGRVTTVIDGNGNRAELHYDAYDRQDRWTFPSTTRPGAYNDATQATALASAGSVNASDYEEYGYDPNGNRMSLRKRDNTTLTYQYDALNRMIVKVVPERPAPNPYPLTPAQTRDVFYSYDLRGLQLSARFDSQWGEGVTSAYDGFGRLASSIIDLGWIARPITYQYDPNGNRTRITHPDGTWFASTYDGLNRPVLLFSPQSWLVYSGYNSAGLPQVISRSNDTWSGRYYDGIQRPSAFDLMPIGAPHGVSWTFDRNPAGQISVIARSNPGSSPGQADDYAWTGHYAVNRPYTSNGLNQYSAAGGAGFGYDANGNLTSDGSRTYTYDIENRLISASPGVTLSYDPLGRLFQVGSGADTTTFLYDGDALVAEYDGANAMTRRYAHSVGADVPMVEYLGAAVSDPHHLFPDHQGSVVAATGAGGAMLFRNAYDEYGIPGAANAGRFQYTGQIWIDELGMYHYKARIYSPTLGRFLQTDPVGYEGGINLYGYVENDPVNSVDPDGQTPAPMINALPQSWRDAVEDTIRDFAIGDIETAVRNPTAWNIAVAGAGLVPVGRAVRVGRLVIGKLDDLGRATFRQGEFRFAWAARGSPQANWRVNSALMRAVMRTGHPIRDVSVNPRTGALINNTDFLRAERNLLRNHGWTYNPNTRLWTPPRQAQGFTRDPCTGRKECF